MSDLKKHLSVAADSFEKDSMPATAALLSKARDRIEELESQVRRLEAKLERVRSMQIPNLLRSLIHEDLIDDGEAVRQTADEIDAALTEETP